MRPARRRIEVGDDHLRGLDLALGCFALTAPRRPATPSMRGTLNPQMSASSTPTGRPCAAEGGGEVDRHRRLAHAALAARDRDDAVVAEISVSAARARGLEAGPLHHRRALGLGHLGVLDGRLAHAGEAVTFEITSALICPRRGHPAVVSATCTRTSPSAKTSTSRSMPRSTMLAPSWVVEPRRGCPAPGLVERSDGFRSGVVHRFYRSDVRAGRESWYWIGRRVTGE